MKLWLRLLVLICSSAVFSVHGLIVHTIFGEVNEQHPVVIQLLESNALQRLKHIDQSGPEPYLNPSFPKLSRYDHSLGVYALLKRYNVSLEEQMAGLMHDVSHTVFSHLGDIVFQKNELNGAYQDNIHDWFLSQMHVDDLIAPLKLKLRDISPKNPRFTALEQSFPDMNADRIEYNLHTALVFNDLSNQEVENILQALEYKDNKWYFTDTLRAKQFAKLSTYYTKAFWGNPRNVALYQVSAAAIKYAFEQGIITKDDMHFGIDQDVLARLRASRDQTLQQLLTIMTNIEQHFTVAASNDYDVHVPVKMRGIDPLVLTKDGKLQRLTSLSVDFNNEYRLTQEFAKHGVYIKYKNITNKDLLGLIKKSNA